MHAALTIRDLDDDVAQKLQLRAARNGRTVEAEVREIVTVAVAAVPLTEAILSANDALHADPRVVDNEGKFDHVIGIWKGRIEAAEAFLPDRLDAGDFRGRFRCCRPVRKPAANVHRHLVAQVAEAGVHFGADRARMRAGRRIRGPQSLARMFLG